MEKIYCSYCGKENKLEKELCKKCFKKLHPKDHLLIEYIKSKIKGKYEDSLFSIIKNYIQSHLYGFLMACSILITSATIFVSVANNNAVYEIVTERPPEVIIYAGVGLNGAEVVEKYVDAILKDDMKTVRNLQLETFYPNIREEIKNIKKEQRIESPILNHDFVEHGKYYIKGATNYFSEKKYSIEQLGINWDDPRIAQNPQYENYAYERYVIGSAYCTKGDCSIDGGFWNFMNDLIEVIEVDGNFYVNGEAMDSYEEESDYIFHRYLQRMQGDLSHYTHEPFYDGLTIECVENDSCLEEKGLK